MFLMEKGVGYMADQRHLNKLNEGVSAWNQWREEHPEILPDLRKADLHEAVLSGVDFRQTNLDGVNLRNARLCSVSLNSASLCQANLSGARLRHASMHKTFFKETILQHANFHKAYLLDIAEAVQSREKLLVVLSKNSLDSEWVEREVTLARQKEGKGKREVLVPICLDSAILNSTIDWAIAIRKRRHIRSFENWQQSSRYQKMLKDLLNDLRRE